MVEATETSGNRPKFQKYFIDPARAEAAGRSLQTLVASRLCQQGLEDEEIVISDPQNFFDLILEYCSQQPDFLLPDTPLKEAIFRTLLLHGNEPMDAEQISAYIGQKWSMTQFPRDTSPAVIQALLDGSSFYCLGPVSE